MEIRRPRSATVADRVSPLPPTPGEVGRGEGLGRGRLGRSVSVGGEVGLGGHGLLLDGVEGAESVEGTEDVVVKKDLGLRGLFGSGVSGTGTVAGSTTSVAKGSRKPGRGRRARTH